MAKLDITKPEIILLLTEAYEKEKRLRSFWVSKNIERIQLAATLTREPTNYYQQDVIKKTMVEGMATITRDHAVSFRHRKKVPIRDATTIPAIESIKHENSLIDLGVGNAEEDPRLARPDTDLSPDPVMRPVDPDTKSILYKTKPGRLQYLNKRARFMPEKKYYFPECMSWVHGWRLCDSKMQQGCQYGRKWSLQRDLDNRIGPTREPDDPRATCKNLGKGYCRRMWTTLN